MKKILIALFLLLFVSTASADAQTKRLNLITEHIINGTFEKTEIPGNIPHLWVKPKFYVLDFDNRSKIVGTVWSYYITMDSRYDSVILYDSRTGKKVGIYGEKYGGLKMH